MDWMKNGNMRILIGCQGARDGTVDSGGRDGPRTTDLACTPLTHLSIQAILPIHQSILLLHPLIQSIHPCRSFSPSCHPSKMPLSFIHSILLSRQTAFIIHPLHPVIPSKRRCRSSSSSSYPVKTPLSFILSILLSCQNVVFIPSNLPRSTRPSPAVASVTGLCV